MENIYLTAGQVRAARALLRWSADKLAVVSGVSVVAIRRTEAKDEPVTMMRANVAAIRRALEAAGVEFIAPNGGGPGVRLRADAPTASGAPQPPPAAPAQRATPPATPKAAASRQTEEPAGPSRPAGKPARLPITPRRRGV